MIPKLRFPDFIGDWKTITFGELVEDGVILKPMDGNHGEIHPTSKDYVEEGVPFLMASDISNGQINFNDCKRISELTAKGLRKGFAQNNDVLLTHKGTVGETAVLETDLDFVMLTPQVTYYRVKDKSMLESYFLHSAFQAPRFQKNLNIISGGGTRAYIGITKQLLLKMSIPAVSEQKRIASIFLQLDQKINLLTKKREALETYKKGLMQKIFSQELRFKREDGTDYPEWNNSTLDELFTSRKGKGLSLNDIADDGINKCLLYGSLYTKYNEVISKCVEFTDTIESVFANNNDLLVPASTTTSGIDLATFSCLQINDVMIGGDVTILTPIDKHDSRWWAYYLSHHKKPDIAKFAQGSTIVHLYFNHFKKLKVDYPTIEEQRKTVELLMGIDAKIDWVQAHISLQLELKKGLLQQMFV